VGGQYCADCHEWVELEEPVDRPAPYLPDFAADGTDDAEPNKKREKENLTYSSHLYNFHS
jgi:hypothetical protein